MPTPTVLGSPGEGSLITAVCKNHNDMEQGSGFQASGSFWELPLELNILS